MPDYDFRNLNHHEFQVLNNDLFSAEFNIHVERFKSGKDRGIDGRFFEKDGKVCIIQSKHYVESGKKILIRGLEKEELPKLHKIKPDRYIIATSVPLLEVDKDVIKEKMSPYILSTSDIYGKDEINFLLSKHEHIERSHYKLWIISSVVLNKFINSAIYNASSELVADAIRCSSAYVKTVHHDNAKKILDGRNVIVITGEPGVGKTALAKQLCLQYVHEGFIPVLISEDIKEGFSVLNKEERQIFYYDDFLGSNYLEAIRGNEDSRIIQFITTIRNSPNSKFILTSRTNILEQGYRLSQAFSPRKFAHDEYILNVDKLGEYDKGLILYSFMWNSEMPRAFLEGVISQEIYLEVIRHKNYNPRLMEAITNKSLVDAKKPEDYFKYISDSLNDPSHVWGHAYNIQSDEISRRIIDFVALSNGGIEESRLMAAIACYKQSNPILPPSNTSQYFHEIIKTLCRSFISRNLTPNDGVESMTLTSGLAVKKGQIWYTPFNPSVTDFVISRYTRELKEWAQMILYYPTNEGLKRVRALLYWSKDIAKKIINELFQIVIQCPNRFHPFLLGTVYSLSDDGKKAELAKAVNFRRLYSHDIAGASREDCSDLVELCCASINDQTPHAEVIDFLKNIIHENFHYYALELISEVCISLCVDDSPHFDDLNKIQERFVECLNERWVEEIIDDFLHDNLDDVISYDMDEDGNSDYYIDEYSLICKMIDHTEHLFGNISMEDAKYILEWKDLDAVVRNRQRDNDNGRSGGGQYSEHAQDSLGTLFDGFIGAKYGKGD